MLSEEKRTVLIRQEENAIMNQLILFVQRIINLRTPVEFQEGRTPHSHTAVCVHVCVCVGVGGACVCMCGRGRGRCLVRVK